LSRGFFTNLLNSSNINSAFSSDIYFFFNYYFSKQAIRASITCFVS
jgi:hypothetical protein